MAKSKRLGVSIFVVILTIVMAVSVVMTFATSYIFGNDGVSGKLFGSHIYIMETDDMYSDPVKKTVITKGSAIIAEDEDTFPPGTVILFKNGAREDVMRVQEVTYDENKSVYHVASDLAPEKTYEVKDEDVIAKSVTVSENLGAVIRFFSSVPGIIVGMILPCFVILAMLIIKIVSMKKVDEEDEEEYDEYDDEDDDDEFEGFNGHKVKSLHHSASSGSPLFNPESDINPTDEFERKKSSIAMNFSQKGAAAKRPARDRREAPKAAVERFREAVEEKPRVPVAKKGSLVPEGQEVSSDEKLAAIKAALSGQEAPKPAPSRRTDDVEKTARFTAIKEDVKPSPVRPAAKPASKTPAKPATRPVAPKPSDKASNISSIDDLIKILEEEKKKL